MPSLCIGWLTHISWYILGDLHAIHYHSSRCEVLEGLGHGTATLAGWECQPPVSLQTTFCAWPIWRYWWRLTLLYGWQRIIHRVLDLCSSSVTSLTSIAGDLEETVTSMASPHSALVAAFVLADWRGCWKCLLRTNICQHTKQAFQFLKRWSYVIKLKQFKDKIPNSY